MTLISARGIFLNELYYILSILTKFLKNIRHEYQRLSIIIDSFGERIYHHFD
jgi:hypothetical protein